MRAWIFLFFLTQSALAEPCVPLVEEPGVRVEACGALHVAHLAGPPETRARAFGTLLHRGVLSRDVFDYFSNKVPEEIAAQAGWLRHPLILAYHQGVRLFHRTTPPALTREIDAFAAGLGVDPILARRALSLPDTAVLLQGLGSLPGLGFLPAMGCTSAAARLADGGFVVGRNLDFAGVGTFDLHPLLLVSEPPPGSPELRHAAIGADGLLFGGITGVNEAGLTFAVHQNYTRDAGITGLPIALIGELVLRSAHNLAEAEAILEKNRPAALWTFMVTDLRHREAMAVESAPDLFLVRRQDEAAFAQTNHAMHAESRASENASRGVVNNSVFRLEHVYRALLDPAAPANLARLAAALAYQEDPGGQLSAHHDVLKALTLQTALFEAPAAGDPTLYLSVDPAPAASGRFAAFSLPRLFGLGPSEFRLTDLSQTPPARRQNQLAQSEAFRTYFDGHDPSKAADQLRNHATLDAALFRAVALYQAEDFSASLAEAEAGLREPRFLAGPAYLRESLELTRLAALTRLGQVGEARALAARLNERGVSRTDLKNFCQKLLAGSKVKAPPLAFDFFSGDLRGRND